MANTSTCNSNSEFLLRFFLQADILRVNPITWILNASPVFDSTSKRSSWSLISHSASLQICGVPIKTSYELLSALEAAEALRCDKTKNRPTQINESGDQARQVQIR
jgi:hypothetical protein